MEKELEVAGGLEGVAEGFRGTLADEEVDDWQLAHHSLKQLCGAEEFVLRGLLSSARECTSYDLIGLVWLLFGTLGGAVGGVGGGALHVDNWL